MVEEILAVPKDVSSAIRRINDTRNALAHSLFPENRRRYVKEKKLMHNGLDVFSLAGIEGFKKDYNIARKYLWKKVSGKEAG